jgi:hypothetical protein
MRERPTPPFEVFRTEPLMRAIAATGISPVALGIAFFLCVSLTLSIWASLSETPQADPRYVSFFENISWSISMIFLFPVVVALTLRYYREIPNLFAFLLRETAESPEHQPGVSEYYAWLDRRFNSYWVTGGALAVTVILNLVYFYQILEHQDFPDWITNGELFSFASTKARGLTFIGSYAALIQVVLIYWVLNLLWRGAVLAWGLHEFFNRRNFPIGIEPLHPDRCCGLRKIGDVAMLLNLTLFLLGIYISLKVVDKIVIQDSPLGADIGNPIMLGGYLMLAPLLFFFPLGAAHRRMNEARQRFLTPISQRCEGLLSELVNAGLDEKGLTAVQTFSELDGARSRLRKEIPVWPFDFRSLQAFFATIVIPIVPIVLPFVIDLVFGG